MSLKQDLLRIGYFQRTCPLPFTRNRLPDIARFYHSIYTHSVSWAFTVKTSLKKRGSSTLTTCILIASTSACCKVRAVRLSVFQLGQTLVDNGGVDLHEHR